MVTVVVTLVMLLVVALWWHCGDTVVIVVVTVFIVVALVVRWSLLVSQDVSVTAFRAPGILEPCGSYIDHLFPGRLKAQFHVRRMELLPEVLRGSHDLGVVVGVIDAPFGPPTPTGNDRPRLLN